MNKILKRTLLIAGALLLALAAALCAVLLLVDPNEYRAEIAAAFNQATGRQLSMKGPLSLKIFPRLALRAQDLSLAQAPGFTEDPLAEVEEVTVSIALLPLLSKSIEADIVSVRGLKVVLLTDKTGRKNWELPLAAENAAASPGPQPQTAPAPEEGTQGQEDTAAKQLSLLTSGIDELRLENCTLDYRNLASGQSLLLRLKEVALREVALNREVPCLLDLEAEDRGSGAQGSLQLKGRAQYLLEQGQASLQIDTFTLKGQFPQMPQFMEGQELRGSMAATFHPASASGTLQAVLTHNAAQAKLDARFSPNRPAEGSLELAGNPQALALLLARETPHAARLSGFNKLEAGLNFLLQGAELNINNAYAALGDEELRALIPGLKVVLSPAAGSALPFSSLDGSLSLRAKPRPLLSNLGLNARAADAQALRNFSLNARFRQGHNEIKLNSLVILDQSSLEGDGVLLLPGARALPSWALASFKAVLRADELDADRYLPLFGSQPGNGKTGSPGPATGQGGEQDADAADKVLLGSPLDKVQAELSLEMRRLILNKTPLENISLTALLERGTLSLSRARFNVFGGSVKASGTAALNKPRPDFSLRADLLNLDLGGAMAALLNEQRLRGSGDLKLDLSFRGLKTEDILSTLAGNGALKIRNGVFAGPGLIPASAPEIIARHRSPDGLYTFKDISGNFKASGGRLINEALNIQGAAAALQGKGSLDLLKQELDYRGVLKTAGLPLLPLRLSGPLRDPSLSLDIEGAAQSLPQALQKNAEDAAQELRKTLPEVKGLDKALQKRLENLLK